MNWLLIFCLTVVSLDTGAAAENAGKKLIILANSLPPGYGGLLEQGEGYFLARALPGTVIEEYFVMRGSEVKFSVKVKIAEFFKLSKMYVKFAGLEPVMFCFIRFGQLIVSICHPDKPATPLLYIPEDKTDYVVDYSISVDGIISAAAEGGLDAGQVVVDLPLGEEIDQENMAFEFALTSDAVASVEVVFKPGHVATRNYVSPTDVPTTVVSSTMTSSTLPSTTSSTLPSTTSSTLPSTTMTSEPTSTPILTTPAPNTTVTTSTTTPSTPSSTPPSTMPPTFKPFMRPKMKFVKKTNSAMSVKQTTGINLIGVACAVAWIGIY